MKFVRDVTAKGITIPAAALKLCGFEGTEKAELHANPDAMVVLKGKMTAMELIHAAQYLQELSAELTTHLAKVCGQCDGCGGEHDDEDAEACCPMGVWHDDEVNIPAELREQAGIPKDAKLCFWVDEDENSLIFAAADYDHDLRDVPPLFLEMFTAADVCIGELEERLILGDIVYGG